MGSFEHAYTAQPPGHGQLVAQWVHDVLNENCCRAGRRLRCVQHSALRRSGVQHCHRAAHRGGAYLICNVSSLLSLRSLRTVRRSAVRAAAAPDAGARVLSLTKPYLPSRKCNYCDGINLIVCQVNINTMCELGSGGVSLTSMARRTLGVAGTRAASATYLFLHYALLVACALACLRHCKMMTPCHRRCALSPGTMLRHLCRLVDCSTVIVIEAQSQPLYWPSLHIGC